MVTHKFFSPTGRDGATPRKRVQRTGYFRKGRRGQLNETIVLGAARTPPRAARGEAHGSPATSSDTNTRLTVDYASR